MKFTSETARLALHGAIRSWQFDDPMVLFEDELALLDPAWVPWKWYRWCYPPPLA